MKSFEDFKSSREKLDPSSRKMNAHQWQQAYAAYKSTRERVRSHSSEGSRRRSGKGTSKTTSGMHTPSSVTPTALLRRKVRAMSGYEEVRLLVNLLAWIGIAVVVGLLIAQCIFYSSTESYLTAIAYAAIRIVSIFFMKTIAQILIDIPDIALYRMHAEATETQDAQPDAEATGADE